MFPHWYFWIPWAPPPPQSWNNWRMLLGQKLLGFPCDSVGKESACNVGGLGSIPGLGRSPGGGHGNPFQRSCLENPHGQRSLADCMQSMGSQRDRHVWVTKHSTAHSTVAHQPRYYWKIRLKHFLSRKYWINWAI